jgi:DNA (cytosine-5)-methyltransferase 1
VVKKDAKKGTPGSAGRVVELFAGVGGFRLGLESAGWQTVWANQWEPGTKTQHAADCYRSHWDDGSLVNEDIAKVLDEIEAGDRDPIPDHDLLVGGFPCQDYSVAKTLSQAEGIRGKKGVLWWQIHKILETKRPRMLFLENVDRLLKSPASQRGRDFAIILACLSDLGYMVEWRVVNAADYGFPQRRRRVFIVGHQVGVGVEPQWNGPLPWLYQDGALAKGTPVWPADDTVARLDPDARDLQLKGHPAQITQEFGWSNAVSPFLNAGVMCDRQVWTRKVEPNFDGKFGTLRDVLVDEADVPEAYFIPERQTEQWVYLKGPKREKRIASNGHEYHYSEGGIRFPDPLDKASRTILTGEGGSTPSRFKHVIQASDGRLRRLMPIELERLNGFPDDWTNTGMPDGRRAFMMGNALVVGLVGRAGAPLAGDGSLLQRPSLALAHPS